VNTLTIDDRLQVPNSIELNYIIYYKQRFDTGTHSNRKSFRSSAHRPDKELVRPAKEPQRNIPRTLNSPQTILHQCSRMLLKLGCCHRLPLAALPARECVTRFGSERPLPVRREDCLRTRIIVLPSRHCRHRNGRRGRGQQRGSAK